MLHFCIPTSSLHSPEAHTNGHGKWHKIHNFGNTKFTFQWSIGQIEGPQICITWIFHFAYTLNMNLQINKVATKQKKKQPNLNMDPHINKETTTKDKHVKEICYSYFYTKPI